MFNQYPYLNLNDLNLDYILKAIKEMRYEVTNFVSINAIKYADPIQWNITSQYEKNTIVIDPVTGTAYISVAPVPAGVALTRPEYWTVVFDLGSFVTRAAQNFTSRWESDTTTTATFATPAGAWLVWGDVLYKAKTNITAGDTYVVDGNIEHFTIEDLYNTYLNTIASILAMVGDLADLTTSDASSIVNAINSVVQDYKDADDAINVTIGNLNNLETTNKNSLVSAINENVTSRTYINIKLFGAKGDGITDDTAAFNAAFSALSANGGTIYCNGRFIINANLNVPKNVVLAGDEKVFRGANETTDLVTCNALLLNPLYTINLGENAAINGLAILNSNLDYSTANDSTGFIGTAITLTSGCSIHDCGICGFALGIDIKGNGTHLDNLSIDCIACIEITKSYDCNYFNNIHCWPIIGGWSGSLSDIVTHTHRNGIGIYIHGNADGTKMTNIFVFNHATGIFLEETADQEYANVSFDRCNLGLACVRADNILFSNLRVIECNTGVQLDQTGINLVGLDIYKMHYAGILLGATTPIGYAVTSLNIAGARIRDCPAGIYFNDEASHLAYVNISDVQFYDCNVVYNYVKANPFVHTSNILYARNTEINATSNEPAIIDSSSTLTIDPSFNFVVVAGTNTINDFDRQAHSGDKITLLFNEPLTINDGAHLSVGGTLNVTAKQVIEFVNFRGIYYIV